MKTRKAILAVLMLSTVLLSCTPKAKDMDSVQIQNIVRESLLEIDSKTSDSMCEEEYRRQDRVGDCYALKEEDDVVATAFYAAMQKKGFTPERTMRQDYQAWTGALQTPDRRKSISFNIRTVLDSTKEMGLPYTVREMGYRTLVIITQWDSEDK